MLIERIFIGINIFIPIFYYVIRRFVLDISDDNIFGYSTETQAMKSKGLWIFYFVMCILFFLWNLYLLIYFCKMGFFYIEFLQETYHIKMIRSKIIIISVLIYILIALIPYFIFNEIDMTICYFGGQRTGKTIDTPESQDFKILMWRIFDYFRNSVQYIIASSITFVIIYLAKGAHQDQ